jgi:hypothetical protein
MNFRSVISVVIIIISIEILSAIKIQKYLSVRSSLHSMQIATSFLHREIGSDVEIDPADIITLRRKLLEWYQINRRLLPWRGDRLVFN